MLLYQSMDPKTNWDLWTIPVSGERKPALFLLTAFAEQNAGFSPDSRWVAYDSNESGRQEVYVRPFSPGAALAGARWQVSGSGGSNPKWRRDGKELFFLAPDRTMMVAAVQSAAALQLGPPRPLFSIHGLDPRNGFAVTPDGQRFLIPMPSNDESSRPATVVINWTIGLRR
jgi:hypothetical protein